MRVKSHTQQQRYYSTNSTEGTTPPKKPPKAPRRIAVFGLLLAGTFFYLQSSPTPPSAAALNDTTFTPYIITSRTALSPSSFVLSITPNAPSPSPIYLLPNGRWRHPLWSVEFKQPEVQISRHYTPLPPSSAPLSLDEKGELRFYIRAVGDGEMTRYLGRLRKGDNVWLRGPHVGFDLVKRLGASKSIVFLAGGTGVVPGMQAAKVALDGYKDTKVSLLWAVRKREEIQNVKAAAKSWWATPGPEELENTPQGATPVAKQLADMKTQYGDRLSVQIIVDEENASFNQSHIQKTLSAISDTTASGDNCALHDQRLHEPASEFEYQILECVCVPTADGPLPGKNLFIVSGPDGFVSHYAGPKIWEGGKQTQGPVDGVAGRLYATYPDLARDWLVLKL